MEIQNFDIFEIIENQFKLAQFFFENNKSIIVFAELNYYCWDEIQTLWVEKKKNSIVSKITNYFTNYLENLKSKITDGNKLILLGKSKNRVGNSKFASGIFDYCQELFINDDFMKTLDFTKHIINFKNGKLNLKNGEFSKRTITDIYSKCLNYDYNPDISNDIVAHIRNIFFRICNNDEELNNFVLSFLGYCITGETDLQHFIYILGISASNGKSTMLDIMHKCFNIYVYQLANNTFEVDYKDRKNNLYIAECQTD